MKRAVFFLAAVLLLLACLPAFSQQQQQPYPKDAFVKTVHIEKIWVHPLGYEVVYFMSTYQMGTMFVPVAWFRGGVNAKAELIYGNSPEYPYFSIFWIDGKFDHVRLYVLENYSSRTWDVIDPSVDLTARFNVQEPPKDF